MTPHRVLAACMATGLVAASILPIGCGGASADQSNAPDQKGAPLQGAGPGEGIARIQPIEDLFLLTGELGAVQSLEMVSPRTEQWRVQIKWLVEDGADVKPGDPIVEFDNTSVAQTLEEKRLARTQAENNLDSRTATLASEGKEKGFAVERARLAAERARAQADVPAELMSRREWQEKQAALRQAEAALTKARFDQEAFTTSSRAEIENLQIARDKAARAIELAQHTLELLAVKAPKAGIVVVSENWNEERKYQVGDNLWPGLTVASIPDLTKMEAIAYLSDVDDGRIAAGMPARCILDTYPDRIFDGKVDEVGAVADKKGFRVRIALESSDPAIMRPGMSARVEVVRHVYDHALTVPRQAVERRGAETFVHVAGGKDLIPVRIEACTATDCVVASGLGEGDRVRLAEAR